MGWYDEQIRQRRRRDQEAMDEILKCYHLKGREVPETLHGLDEQLDFLLRPHGVMRRTVRLDKGWYRRTVGAMLGARKADGAVVALIPRGLGGYSYLGPDTGRWVRLDARGAEALEAEAIAFYKPLPLKKIGIAGLMRYILETLSRADLVLLTLITLAVSLVGLLLPRLQQILFSTVVDSGSVRLLTGVVSFMVCVSLSSLLLSAARVLTRTRISTRVATAVEAASMMRVLSLPASFFRKYATGDLATRTMNLRTFSGLLVSSLWSSGLLSLFSLIYVGQIFSFAPSLTGPALVVIAATLAFSLATAFAQRRQSERMMEESAKESGLTYALISGVQKLRLAGAERRAFAQWSERYARLAATAARIQPILRMARPMLEETPEAAEEKQAVERFGGAVELNQVSFRYSEDAPNVIDRLSLKIRPG